MNANTPPAGESADSPEAPAAAEPEKTRVSKEFKHKSPLIACRFDPKGRFVFASAEDNSVQCWDLETGRQSALVGHDSWVFDLGFHPDGETIVTGGGDGQLIWWPTTAQSPAATRQIPAHLGCLRSVAVSPDGASIATCGNDRHVKLWSFAEGTLRFDGSAHAAPVYRVGFDPSGRFLLSADLRGVVIQWDIETGKEARRLDAAKLYQYNSGQGVDYGGVRTLAFSPDGKVLACGGLIEATNPLGAINTPAVLLLDWETGQPVQLQRPKEATKGVVWGLRFHPSGFLIAASGGSGGGYLWFYRPDQTNEFFKLKLPNTARDLDLHPDGLRLATAHFDNQVRICVMRSS